MLGVVEIAQKKTAMPCIHCHGLQGVHYVLVAFMESLCAPPMA